MIEPPRPAVPAHFATQSYKLSDSTWFERWIYWSNDGFIERSRKYDIIESATASPVNKAHGNDEIQ